MVLVIQKYGGTSVGSVELIHTVARRVHKTVLEGNAVVVVVSAMGKTTDTLIDLARKISSEPSRREIDMLLSTGEQVSIALLSMALHGLGQPAISLTGAQVGIFTEARHSRARVLKIRTARARRHLKEGKVVVVAGFQGITNGEEMEITTLGRGGSDTSAVALAAALEAERCEIYTDVPGILTTDPRLVPEARLLNEITCGEMLELASLGTKVLHPRAVEIARNYGVELVVRSTWSDVPGTRVVSPIPKLRSLEGLEIGKAVDAVEFDLNRAKVALSRVPDSPEIAARLFGEVASREVDVDLIIQSIHEENINDLAFTVNKEALPRAEAAAEAIASTLRSGSFPEANESEVFVERQIAIVSISGAGMIGRPGIAARMFSTLTEAGINIQMISTSEVKVSCVLDVPGKDESRADSLVSEAIAVLCREFEIDSSPVRMPSFSQRTPAPPTFGITLELNQARLAIRHVPDRPGMAAKIFTLLAEEHISVDMIVQSQRRCAIKGLPTYDIAFTIFQEDAKAARRVLEVIASSLVGGEILVNENLAKVSVVGTGMVGQPGVAARIFEAMVRHQINVWMIASSEIKISCVVVKEEGESAVRAVHEALGLTNWETTLALVY